MKRLEHLKSYAKPTNQEKRIIILDGHHSHKTLAAIDSAGDNGIEMITLPPHSTHKMHQIQDELQLVMTFIEVIVFFVMLQLMQTTNCCLRCHRKWIASQTTTVLRLFLNAAPNHVAWSQVKSLKLIRKL